MDYDVLIVGAGPGGLACAKRAAEHGLSTLVIERGRTLGRKVCAGGITWNGLLKKKYGTLAEKRFPRQQIFSCWQTIEVTAATPIIATISRVTLAELMAKEAQAAGAKIRLGQQVTAITGQTVSCTSRLTGKRETISGAHLVGADGSSSLVRRSLGLPVKEWGIGIHYQLPGDLREMEWHLDGQLFGNGYAWVFPHRHSFSLGAYADSRAVGAIQLHRNLLGWAHTRGFGSLLEGARTQAERISFDFRGWRFGKTFLVGDAAGLASGLTGEGIYSAIISGETVAETIAHPNHRGEDLQQLLKNHARHRRAVKISGRHPLLARVLAELTVFALRSRLIDFRAAEMAR